MRQEDLDIGKLFEGIQDAVIVADAKTQRIILWNPAATNVFGYSVSEALGLRVEALIPEHLKAQHRAGIARYDETGRGPYIDSHRTLELPALRKDGEEIRVELSLTPIELADDAADDHGRFVLAIVREITGRKRAEEEIQSLNENLERRVAERTAELEATGAELKTKELMLRESEERFRSLIQYVSDIIAVIEADGTIRYVSPSLERVMGYKPEELIGSAPSELLHPDNAEQALSTLTDIWSHPGVSSPAEIQARHADGSWRYLEAIGNNLLDDPVVGGVVLVLRDVTERKRTEEALKESEERFRSTFDKASIGMGVSELDGRFVQVNRSLCEMLGYSEEELLATTFLAITHPDDLEADIDYMHRMMEGIVDTFQTEKRFIHADGHVVWVSLNASIVKDQGEQPLYFIAQIENITERKRTGEAQAWLAAVVESSDDAIIGKTLDGIITSWNSGAQKIYGYSAEEVIGKPINILVPPDRPNEISWILDSIRRGKAVDYYETTRVKKNGDRIYVSITVSPITDPAGNIVGASAIARDITEHKRIENALRQSEELYRAVVEQAAENIFLVDVETKRILQANAALHRSLGYTAEELRRMTLYDIVAGDRESIDRNFRRVMEERQAFLGERRYRRKDASLMDVEVSVSALHYAGREVQCVVAHDVTERKQAEESLKRSLDVLLALREAGLILGSTLESEEIGTRLLRIMRGISGLSTVAIVVRDERGQLRTWRSVGLEQLPHKARYSPEAETARHAALEAGEPRLFQLRGPDLGNGNLTGLCLPLRVRERIIGVLEAYGPENLTEEDAVEMLRSLTAQAASALENARLYHELSEREKQLEDLIGKLLTAQEEERRRVAYEVHDGLAQLATAAHNYLQSFARFQPPESGENREILDQALDLVQRTVTEARKVIANLRPTALDDFGLQTALQLEAEELRNDGWHVDYEGNLRDSERLPDAIETALFRVAQEALRNVRKHADTKRVRLSLQRLGQKVHLSVQDWGRGFDPASIPSDGGPGERVGLSSMRERVALLGGELEIRSEPGAGTLVRAEIPLQRQGETDRE